MADQTSPIQQIQSATNVATRVNENFDAASPSMLFGRNAATTAGLTWGYIGGRFGGALIASGTVALTASTTNYITAALADGAVTASTATTHWDDAAGYLRLYEVAAGAAAVTDYKDHRQAIGAGRASSIAAADITDSTDVGRAVLTAGDPAAARSAIGAGTSNFSGAYGDLSGKPTLGTAAALNVAASGNAAAGEVVKGDDTRLSGSGGAWGSITGTLSSQTDLQAALDAKANIGELVQNSQSAAYTLLLSDKGKHIFHPSADTTARTWTIPANASVTFPIGTAVTFVNQNAAGVITIAITTDVMRLAGAGTTGSRTLAANGQATALKITATEWQIAGVGLT